MRAAALQHQMMTRAQRRSRKEKQKKVEFALNNLFGRRVRWHLHSSQHAGPAYTRVVHVMCA